MKKFIDYLKDEIELIIFKYYFTQLQFSFVIFYFALEIIKVQEYKAKIPEYIYMISDMYKLVLQNSFVILCLALIGLKMLSWGLSGLFKKSWYM